MATNKNKDQEIKVEPGAEVRLANILKRVLNTPPKATTERKQKKVAKRPK